MTNDRQTALQLSASSLARFDRCRRLFHLQDLVALRWPAPPSPTSRAREAASLRGHRFHQLVESAALGVDPVAAIEAANDPSLARWWREFGAHAPRPTGRAFHEVELSAPLDGHRLRARLDRLEVDADGRVIVSDWKTGRLPWDARGLAESWQTCLYLYLVVEAGADILGTARIEASKVMMRYWHVDRPRSPIEIGYDRAGHDAARSRLQERLAAIDRLVAMRDRAAFPKTDVLERCRTCVYQSYCGRGAEEEDPAALRFTDAGPGPDDPEPGLDASAPRDGLNEEGWEALAEPDPDSEP